MDLSKILIEKVKDYEIINRTKECFFKQYKVKKDEIELLVSEVSFEILESKKELDYKQRNLKIQRYLQEGDLIACRLNVYKNKKFEGWYMIRFLSNGEIYSGIDTIDM